MFSYSEVQQLLRPFNLELSQDQLTKLLKYNDLLSRWSTRINLTSITNPAEIITRHFGESLYLSTLLTPPHVLLDVGSGAGFPGLALKIAFTGTEAILLEPVSKKRAFLKEVARACELAPVQVRPERPEEYVAKAEGSAQVVTFRAVGGIDRLLRGTVDLLKENGRVALWTTTEEAATIQGRESAFNWLKSAPIPLSRNRVILLGERKL